MGFFPLFLSHLRENLYTMPLFSNACQTFRVTISFLGGEEIPPEARQSILEVEIERIHFFLSFFLSFLEFSETIVALHNRECVIHDWQTRKEAS